MKLLLLTSSLSTTDGWGAYSAGFLAQARRFFGPENVACPAPDGLRSVKDVPLKRLWLVWDALRLLYAAFRADAIHALVEPAAPLAMALARLTGRPYLISAHGTFADLAAYAPPLRPLYARAFRGAEAVVAVSAYTGAVARRSFGDDLRIEVVPGGFIRPTGQGSRVKGQGQGGAPRILAVGALKPRKGFHTLIDALVLLAKDGAGFHCDLVGSLENESYVTKLIDRVRGEKLHDRIIFKGQVDAEALADLYARADLFVLPSEHVGPAFEGLGLVYLEALARGVPVIGCLDSGATDVIKEGVNGWLVPPAQPEALSAAIRTALSDQVARARMGANGPASVEAFSWDRVAERMKIIWQSISKDVSADA